jgi:uncharacterized membrane protein YkoI
MFCTSNAVQAELSLHVQNVYCHHIHQGVDIMKIQHKVTCLTLALGMTAFAAGSAFADDDRAEMELIAKAAGLISLEEASSMALAAKPGTIIDADLDDREWTSGWDYEFEIIDAAGVEWEVDIDAKTGEVRRVRKDWF